MIVVSGLNEMSGMPGISGMRIHQVPFSLMGVMVPLPYESGDLVMYGSMLYRPAFGGQMIHVVGDYLSGQGDGNAWPGIVGKTPHFAEMMLGQTFYCS